MPSLIESIRKVTVVAAFLFGSLVLESNPRVLEWVDEDNLMCRLKCIHKKKRGHTIHVEKIFDDYIMFKSRKSTACDQNKRSVLLQAIKASPYVEIVENLSTADEKILRFTDKFKQLLNYLIQENAAGVSDRELENVPTSTNDSLMQENSPGIGDHEFENVAICTNDSLMQENAPGIGDHELENVPTSTNDSLMQENSPGIGDHEFENVAICTNDSLMQENAPGIGDHEFENVPICTNGMNMPDMLDQAVVVVVPDVDMEDTHGNVQSSFYAESGSSNHFSSQQGFLSNGNVNVPGPEQSTILPILEQSAPLPAFEQSVPLPLSEENMAFYPPDYDPVRELLHSQSGSHVSSHKALDVHVNSHNKAQSPAFEICDLCSVKVEGKRVHMLTDVGTSSSGLPTHYTFLIRKSSQ